MESGGLALWALTWLLKGRPSLWKACTVWLVFTVASSVPFGSQVSRAVTSTLTLLFLPWRTTWAQVWVSKGRVTRTMGT